MFCVCMAGLIETLISEMVKQREAEERMVAMLERLMKWVEETETERSWRSRKRKSKRNGT